MALYVGKNKFLRFNFSQRGAANLFPRFAKMYQSLDETCCFGILRRRPADTVNNGEIETQSVSSILERLYQIARAKRVQMANLHSAEREARLEAVFYAATNRQVALSHTRIAMDYNRQHVAEQQKYEQITKLIGIIETAQRNLSLATTMFASTKTLQQLLESMPGEANEIMNELREQMHQVQNDDRELSRPLEQQSGIVIAHELDEMLSAAAAVAIATAEAPPISSEKSVAAKNKVKTTN
jgi:hypothetical protein